MLEQAVELTALKEMVGRLTGAMEEEKKLPEKEVSEEPEQGRRRLS